MVRVNLIPQKTRRAQTIRRRVRGWSTVIALGGTLLAVSAGMEWMSRRDALQLRAASAGVRNDLIQVRKELRGSSAEALNAKIRIERAEALRSKRAWSAILALVATSLPDGSWLTSIATDPVTPTGGSRKPKVGADDCATAVTIDSPRKLMIRGYTAEAGDPLRFVQKLNDTDLFSKVRLLNSQREPLFDSAFYRFELLCQW